MCLDQGLRVFRVSGLRFRVKGPGFRVHIPIYPYIGRLCVAGFFGDLAWSLRF